MEINSLHPKINYDEITAAQNDDPETAAYHTVITSLKWEDVTVGDKSRTILYEINTGRPRPLIPKLFRRKIFNIIHGLSHPSGQTTARLMAVGPTLCCVPERVR